MFEDSKLQSSFEKAGINDPPTYVQNNAGGIFTGATTFIKSLQKNIHSQTDFTNCLEISMKILPTAIQGDCGRLSFQW